MLFCIRVLMKKEVRNMRDGKLGHWAFLIGIALVILAGVIPQLQTAKVAWIIVFLGLVVGLLNVTAKETQEFLVAVIAMVLAASSAADMIALGRTVLIILGNVVLFIFPAAFIVAFKTIWRLASER